MEFCNKSIGIFDSGLGGLTAVRELKKVLPHENIIYFGDTGRVPYGTRSNEIIKKYATSDINFLLSKNVKMIIAACGTASSMITEDMIENMGVLYTGVVNPSAFAAYTASKSKVIGVIATNATIKSKKYEMALGTIDKSCTIIKNPCPLFVPLVENGYVNFDNQITRLVAKDYLSVFQKNKDLDTLILGCTHYPILAPIISDILGKEITLIDSGKEAALMARNMLANNDMLNNTNNDGTIQYFVSDSIENFSNNAMPILGEIIEANVLKVDIEKYV